MLDSGTTLIDRAFDEYRRLLYHLFKTATATTDAGETMTLAVGLDRLVALAREAAGCDGRVLFIGNGGSSAIASHMAIDFTKAGGFPAMAFTDAAALTCLANDYGFEEVFARQISMFAQPRDVLVAISSSGCSPDILNAVRAARAIGCKVVTLSGFGPDNPLRAMGDVNLYVGSRQYGPVEVTHLALCHAALDVAAGWRPESEVPGAGFVDSTI